MDSSSGYLPRHSPSSTRFLNLLSSPPSSTAPPDGIGSHELNESEVFWTGDFVVSSNRRRHSIISCCDRGSSFMHPGRNSGIIAAITDDVDAELHRKQRSRSVLTCEASVPMFSSSRSIPRSGQSGRDCSQSGPSRKLRKSAPINVPELPKAMTKQRNGEIDSSSDEEMLPPHEIVSRGSGVSPKTTFSMLEGVGRTLKGRDLHRVRNAVWRKTGFLD